MLTSFHESFSPQKMISACTDFQRRHTLEEKPSTSAKTAQLIFSFTFEVYTENNIILLPNEVIVVSSIRKPRLQ